MISRLCSPQRSGNLHRHENCRVDITTAQDRGSSRPGISSAACAWRMPHARTADGWMDGWIHHGEQASEESPLAVKARGHWHSHTHNSHVRPCMDAGRPCCSLTGAHAGPLLFRLVSRPSPACQASQASQARALPRR